MIILTEGVIFVCGQDTADSKVREQGDIPSRQVTQLIKDEESAFDAAQLPGHAPSLLNLLTKPLRPNEPDLPSIVSGFSFDSRAVLRDRVSF